MNFPKLIEAIERHSDHIAGKVIAAVRNEPTLKVIGGLPPSELMAWCTSVLNRLGTALGGDEHGVAAHYRTIGRLRCEQGVPLHEAVRALQILKERMLDYIRGEGFAQTVVEIYAEEELEFHLGRYFDVLTYNLVAGYEEALRASAYAKTA